MKFSILIPAYKAAFLEECINSCLHQTYSDYEIIIVNDCSPNKLEEIIGKFSDNRIKFYQNEFGCGARNVVKNWNICLGYATGDFTICIGDDDKLKPNCLEDYATLITTYPNLDVYHTRMEIINQNSIVVNIQEERPTKESVYSMIWHFWMAGRKQVLGDWCFKTQTLKEKGGFIDLPFGWNSDNLTAFQFAIEKGVANNKTPGFQYRVSDLTITQKNTPESISGKIEAWQKSKIWYINFLKTTEPQNDIDNIYKNTILNIFDRYMERKIYGEIEHGIIDYPFSIISWLKIARHEGIPCSYVLKEFMKNGLKKFRTIL